MKFTYLLLCSLLIISCSRNKTIPTQIYKNNFEEIGDFLSGHYSNKVQAKSDTLFQQMDLHIVPIYADTDSVKWYYVERCYSNKPKAPIEQVVYKLEEAPSGIKINTFDLPANKPYIGAWKNPYILNNNLSTSLKKKHGCAIFLNKKGKGVYTANTFGKNCRNLFMGSLYSATRILIDKDGLQIWERGYDEYDRLIWGPKKNGVKFEKIKNTE